MLRVELNRGAGRQLRRGGAEEGSIPESERREEGGNLVGGCWNGGGRRDDRLRGGSGHHRRGRLNRFNRLGPTGGHAEAGRPDQAGEVKSTP